MEPPLIPEIDALLRRTAELRAEGNSWPATARQIEIDVDDLRDLCRLHHEAFRKLLKAARREVIDECACEALLFLRGLLRSKDEKTCPGRPTAS